jgi:hypothetical protein
MKIVRNPLFFRGVIVELGFSKKVLGEFAGEGANAVALAGIRPPIRSIQSGANLWNPYIPPLPRQPPHRLLEVKRPIPTKPGTTVIPAHP